MTTAARATLHARTRALPRRSDPLEWLGEGGFAWFDAGTTLVTSGVAARVEANGASEALAAIGGDTERVIACGALPFREPHTGMLTIPARIARIDTDGATLTEVGPADPTPMPTPVRRPRRFTVESVQDLSTWDGAVAAALALIDARHLEKVVLAREVLVAADAAFSVVDVLGILRRTQPGCHVFADGGFVGASPELLVDRHAKTVTSRPMAGTVARQESIAADDAAIAALLESVKDAAEHRVVVEAVVAALTAAGCTDVRAGAPEPVRLTNVTHLTTTVDAEADGSTTALDLALALHPTPAVGGAPREAALRAIERLEGFSRGRYAGPVGFVDAQGDGRFAVALRCAELDGPNARLLAGAGIVRGSDPDAEWAETQAKLEPMLRTLVRP
jgi:menaquinone-specific isochorismate synthase